MFFFIKWDIIVPFGNVENDLVPHDFIFMYYKLRTIDKRSKFRPQRIEEFCGGFGSIIGLGLPA